MGILSSILGMFGMDSIADVVDSSSVTDTLASKAQDYAKDKATDFAKDKAKNFATKKAKSLLGNDKSKKNTIDKNDKYWYLKDK